MEFNRKSSGSDRIAAQGRESARAYLSGEYDRALALRLQHLDAGTDSIVEGMDPRKAAALIAEAFRVVQGGAAKRVSPESDNIQELMEALTGCSLYGFRMGHDYRDRHGNLRNH